MTETGDINVNELTPCTALCCIIYSFYCMPDCFGCSGTIDVCCLGLELYACKAAKEPDSCCLCCKTEVNCNPITTCCDVREQLCCLDIRCSLPPSEQVPCLLTLCFLTVT